MSRKSLEQRLAELETSTGPELSEEWERVYKAPAPRLSADLLRMGIAYRLQEKQLGGLDRISRRVLRAADDTKAANVQQRKLTPGTRLVRDWHGVGHSVTVLEDGFHYDERHWSSLTAIARHITGAKWSGPRFFGLAGGAA
jgi:hypothetical protein